MKSPTRAAANLAKSCAHTTGRRTTRCPAFPKGLALPDQSLPLLSLSLSTVPSSWFYLAWPLITRHVFPRLQDIVDHFKASIEALVSSPTRDPRHRLREIACCGARITQFSLVDLPSFQPAPMWRYFLGHTVHSPPGPSLPCPRRRTDLARLVRGPMPFVVPHVGAQSPFLKRTSKSFQTNLSQFLPASVGLSQGKRVHVHLRILLRLSLAWWGAQARYCRSALSRDF